MRLLLKFNLVLILVFAVGASIAGYLSRRFLQQSAQDQVTQQARLMMAAAGAMRSYTSKQVGPVLKSQQLAGDAFLPQTVPAYSATEVFNYLRSTYPAYTYKEATLNPTNPRDRALDWEAEVVASFRNHPERKEMIGERESAEGRLMFLAQPITAEASCLECHSTPNKAPAAMIKVYGSEHGFNWQLNDTVGAQIVSVPMAVPAAVADRAFRTTMLSLGGVALGVVLILDLLMVIIVIRPATRLSAMAQEISKGNLDVPELPVKGKDEISQLARSFNRMYVSLAKAIRMLEQR